MIVTPLASSSPRAIRDTLLAAGWDQHRAEAAAAGLGPSAVRIVGLDAAALEALIRLVGKAGLDILTGDDWALIAGPYSRLGALARPWLLPPEIAEVSYQLGMALLPDPVLEWRTARGLIRLDQPVVVGIVNVTPDSFSDGGQFITLEHALAQAERLLSDGAMMLDLGGESTRPGAAAVPVELEVARVLPVVEHVARRYPGVPLSVDTVKSQVARAALAAGAWIINDVSGARLDPAMASVIAEAGAGAILMHSRGEVQSMATFDHADYAGDVVDGVLQELRQRLAMATAAGIAADHIVLDPGLGFSKTAEQNLAVLDGLSSFLSLGRPLLVGPSRKRFLGLATGRDIGERDAATAAACALAWERGARLFRVHDPARCRDALAVAAALTHRLPA